MALENISMRKVVDYDAHGHCVVCHRDLITKQAIGQQVQERFRPDYGSMNLLLNDGSRMEVCICTNCRPLVKEDDLDEIMDCVVRGWEKETEELVRSDDAMYSHWSEEFKKKHMEQYNKKKIVCIADGMPEEYLKKRLESFNGDNQ